MRQLHGIDALNKNQKHFKKGQREAARIVADWLGLYHW